MRPSRITFKYLQHQNAFALTEVLIAAALGLITITAAGAIFISHIKTITVESSQLKFQEAWARLSFLIETEVAEGEALSDDASAYVLPTGCGPETQRLFTIDIPVIVGTTSSLTSRQVSYYQKNNDLYRCGPKINSDGTLDTSSGYFESLLLRNAQLTGKPGVTPPSVVANSRAIEYNLTISIPNPPGFSSEFKRSYPSSGSYAQARTKLNQID